jgi:hypothetical protein
VGALDDHHVRCVLASLGTTRSPWATRQGKAFCCHRFFSYKYATCLRFRFTFFGAAPRKSETPSIEAAAAQPTRQSSQWLSTALADAVRQALDEAKASLASAATTAELREFVDRWVGPMVLRPDGTVEKRTPATEDSSEAGVKGLVAGAGFEPATFGL